MDKKLRTMLLILVSGIVILGILLIVNQPNKNLAQNDPIPTITTTPAPTASPAETPTPSPETTPEASLEPPAETDLAIRTDYENYQPNESGEIPIIMFHKMLEAYEPNTEKDYTTTFGEFEALLQTLYDEGYRLISMKDFIDCNISVPAGTKPMVFTFDDGTPSQFSLIEENGMLVVNPRSAVGIMMAFNEKHPDFGLKGIFYVNMDIGDNTFKGAGDLKERFEFLRGLGLEIGSHTYGHVDFKKMTNASQIAEALGRNQKEAIKVLSNLNFYSLALPYGSQPKDDSIKYALQKGEYEGISYENLTILAVGANPSKPSVSKDYNAQYVRRIRAQGRVAVDADLTWWLPKMTNDRMFISDGDPSTIVVPKGKSEAIDPTKMAEKELITY